MGSGVIYIIRQEASKVTAVGNRVIRISVPARYGIIGVKKVVDDARVPYCRRIIKYITDAVVHKK